MAALTQTAGSVAPSSNQQISLATAGGSITAGMPVYLDSSDSNKAKAADANASQAASAAVGIALNSASTGQSVQYQTSGRINLGATLATGTTYYVGATAGEINPSGDLASGWYVHRLGYAVSTSILQMDLMAYGVAVP